jgi:hypothetical protein
MLCVVLVIGSVITALIRSRLRRQEAQNSVDVLLENNNSIAVVSNTNLTANT